MSWEIISGIANIVLTLLLIFQWHRKHASEQATRFNLFATRRMISRLKDPIAADITDNLDATLATLDARSPFTEWSQKVLLEIRDKFRRDAESPLLNTAERSTTQAS